MLSSRLLTITCMSMMVMLGAISCSDNNTGSEEDSRATINGSVEESSSQGKILARDVDGVVVTAARITSNGSFEKIESTETQTNASGEFTLEVDAEMANHMAVIAEHADGDLKGTLWAHLDNDQSYTLKPITTESTAESDIYARVIGDGNGNLVSKTDSEILVKSNTAADIQSSSAAMNELAASLSNYAEARAEYVAETSENSADDTMDEAFELMADAQFQYESDVAATTSQSERDASFEVLMESNVNAWTEAGLDKSSTANLFHMKTNVIENSFSSTSANVRNDVRWTTSYMGAVAVDAAVRARAESSEMSGSTRTEIEEAGDRLKTDIKSSSGVTAEIETAFEAYHDDVRSAMENDSSVEATAVILIDTEINAIGGAKAQFSSALSGVIDALILTDIYADFATDVESDVNANSESIGEIDAEALAELLVLINLYN